SQWEYYARNRGDDVIYPWGNDEPTCDLAVIDVEGQTTGCGTGYTWDVCSKPAGNTEQGLCDMAGNVHEWTGDYYHFGYAWDYEDETYYAPDDGTYWREPANISEEGLHWMVLRGGGVNSNLVFMNRMRLLHTTDFAYSGLGIRCVREPFVPLDDD
ncbi:MAG: SUMF1/EgtB/PvdO family nonheme iron enzyme, partial [Deltaproteobacteria bacterium]|nr:SUMF1/EgtB/PvdO family nonheme iron enzyme [Deltaproteobacteria bacterium]